MDFRNSHGRNVRHFLETSVSATTVLLCLSLAPSALADEDRDGLQPDNILVSKVVYDNNVNNVIAGATQLPPGCVGAACVTATANGAFPMVFNNALVDGSFGITAKIVLDQLARDGRWISSLEVPNNSQREIGANSDQMVGSFSSKSELALNLSADRRFVTFTGYLTDVDALDVSNSNTPGVIDPTNPVSASYYRLIARLDRRGRFEFTKSNAYSGNNGRAAYLNNSGGKSLVYASGNAGNGANPQPAGVVLGAGAQILTAERQPLAAQADPGLPTPVGSFNITQLGDKADKTGKDTNFRGLTVYNDVIYLTKGSGGNGVNTVYFIDTSGLDATGKPLACPSGSGLPAPGAKLPTAPISYDPTQLAAKGVYPYNMCILAGFPTTLAKTATAFPFGMWFANPTTLYVTDEGNGAATFAAGVYTDAAAQTIAGLQKWVLNPTSKQWTLAYVLTAGLNLGAPYSVENYPLGTNAATKAPWSPATDGLRNVTGRVNHDNTATIYAITSTVSGSGDQGADPNELVAITDDVAATALPAGEVFRVMKTARFGEALRGVSLTPESAFNDRR